MRYAGPDGEAAAVKGSCTDNAGNGAEASLAFRYDATPPSVAAAADRPPSGAWYRAPVTVSFGGTDATSGIGGCSAPLRYAGPDGEAAAVKGSCTDNAGNGAEASLAFKYDATAPKLAAPKVEAAKGLVRVSWQRAADFVSTQLVRTPGLGSAKRSVVYKGSGASFADRSVRNGRRYRYELIVGDAAGNLSSRVVTAMPRPPLYRPEPGQRVRAPLTLAWEAASGARFYNVQLLRNGVKVLSAWPRLATLRVRAAWRYAGKARRLEPGRYVWYVWPARGTIERPVFGRPLGEQLVRREGTRLAIRPHAKRPGLPRPAGTATCGSTTSRTRASHESIREPERSNPSARSQTSPPSRSSTATSSVFGDWSAPHEPLPVSADS